MTESTSPEVEQFLVDLHQQEVSPHILTNYGAHLRHFTRWFATAQGKPFAAVRVSELVGLTLDDVDLSLGVLHVRGKELKDRDVPLAKKTVATLTIWLTVRPEMEHRTLFLYRYDGRHQSVSR